jgi:hypothetical protein
MSQRQIHSTKSIICVALAILFWNVYWNNRSDDFWEDSILFLQFVVLPSVVAWFISHFVVTFFVKKFSRGHEVKSDTHVEE